MNRWTGDVVDRPHDRALTCTAEREHPVAVVHVAGRLDDGGVPELQACVRDCLAAEPDVVVPSDEHGRGLLMVEALCTDWGITDWGITCVGGGKVVWAKVGARPA
jgi:hypothetical protein